MTDFKVRYSYLPEQFADPEPILDELRRFLPTGDFTLGKPVGEFEEQFAKVIGSKHAIGVGSGTDALKLSLKAAGVGFGDEVITTANTFIATVGAINEVGARPVFVDCDDTFCMNVDQVEAAIMRKLMPIADKHGLPVVEDVCQGILADIDGKKAGTWGLAGGFSLHPLKNLNVWADGGIIVTDDDDTATKLRLLRNHGLINRDEIEILGYNSRLDSVQAIVGNHLIGSIHDITAKRIANAAFYDKAFGEIGGVRVPDRPADCNLVYHLYIIFAKDRDALLDHCLKNGVEAKVHYPIPLYLQKGLSQYGHKLGDFPVTDRHCEEIITFPADQHLSQQQLDLVVSTVRDFYESR